MQGSRISELNGGLKEQKEELVADPLASKRVEVAIVNFDGEVTALIDFVTAMKFQPPELSAMGNTPMSQAINYVGGAPQNVPQDRVEPQFVARVQFRLRDATMSNSTGASTAMIRPG